MFSLVNRDGESLALSVGWVLVGFALAWFLLGTMTCAIARRRPGLLRLTRFAPPVVRRLAGLTCTAALVLPAPAGAAPPAPAAVAVDEPVVRSPLPPPVEKPTAPPAPSPRRHIVVAGDNLWTIARAEVARVVGTDDASDTLVAPYWQTVVARNRATLRSGDPALIFPGEIVELPAFG